MHIYGLNLKAWKIQQIDSRLPVRVLHTRRKTYTFVVLCFGRRLLFPHERVKCKNTYLQVFQKGCQQQAWNMHPLKLYNLDLKNGFFSLAAKFIMEVCWTFSPPCKHISSKSHVILLVSSFKNTRNWPVETPMLRLQVSKYTAQQTKGKGG